MAKVKKRTLAILLIVAILIGITACYGVAMSVTDTVFKNNTPTYITLGNNIQGKITSSKDYEAYVFDIAENGALTICLEHEKVTDPGKSGWVVTLYKIQDTEAALQKNYTEIAFFESFWADATSDWDPVGLSAGSYCIVVSPGLYFLESEYTLSTSFNPTDTYEKEPNDTREAATSIAVGYGKYGNTSNRQEGIDSDWYSFTLTYDSCVNITLTHEEGTMPVVGWTVTLINENDQKITQFTSRLTDLVIKSGKIGLKAGQYHLLVEAQTDSADEYTILVGSEKAVNFEFEFNDAPEEAILLPQGIGISGSLADRLLSLDKDYYKFTVDGSGYIDVTFTHQVLEGSKKGWNVRILKVLPDGTVTEVVRKISYWNMGTLSINNLGIAAGDYYVLIDGDSVSYNSATYTVKWAFTEKENCELEPNSSMYNCQTLEFNQYYYGSIISSDVTYDEDYYRFNLTSDKNVCVEFSHETTGSSDICWNITVIDDKGEIKKEITSALNQSLASTGVFELPAGVYFVKVETGIYGSELPYKFRVVG